MTINTCSLSGRLVADPIMKSVGDNIAVCQFTLASDKRKKDTGANFIDCVAWKGLADTISKYVKKGNLLVVTGSLDQQTWKDKEGKTQTKIQLVVNDIQFMTPKSDNTPSEEVGLSEKKEEKEEIDLSSIPFN